MEAQLLQSAGTREQISVLLSHGGQDGVSSGHETQRLKTVRRVRSTSEETLIERRVTGISGSAMVCGVVCLSGVEDCGSCGIASQPRSLSGCLSYAVYSKERVGYVAGGGRVQGNNERYV